MSADGWGLPTLGDGDFRYRFTTSVLEQFARSHSYADVLRELVQNEYDAGGTSLEVFFGTDELMVRGNGRAIDSRGWRRLSVMLGTGEVAGDRSTIQPKVNGIGSKNFGLRSLFLFGDRIHVFSGGRQTALDLRYGALPMPKPHPESQGRPGVVIRVPYRPDDTGGLRAFDEEREREAIADVGSALAPTLIKLALPGAARSVRTTTVQSERLGARLRWSQSVRVLDRPSKPLLRTIRMRQEGNAAAKASGGWSEIEYRRAVAPPPGLRGPGVPAYFRAGGGRIRLAASFRISRQRLVRNTAGAFYYPLGAAHALTGFPFSISAPFEMNEDRSQLVPTANSGWNGWLLEQAGAFVVSLLRDGLFEEFGADAYLAADPSAAELTATAPTLVEVIAEHLRREPCWASKARTARQARQTFRSIHELTVATDATLQDFAESQLKPSGLLHPVLARHPAVAALSRSCGARLFTLSSLIRLRCAADDASNLRTRLTDREADWHYTNFSRDLDDEDLQVRFASVIQSLRSQLKPDHRADLAASKATLTADVGLGSPDAPLYVVDEGITGVVPAESTLHPALAAYPVIARLCKPFQPSLWAMTVAVQVADGVADPADMAALRRYVLGQPNLSQKAWAAIRRAPVLLDHRGQTAAAEDMVLRSTRGADILEPALRFLPRDAEKRPLIDRLRIRSKVTGDDLVALAELVANGEIPPSRMRIALERFSRLLTPKTVDRLRDISMLETTTGTLAPPAGVYERNERTLAAFGDFFEWAVPLRGNLLERVGCVTEPAVDDMVERLRSLADADAPLDDADTVYRLLHDSAKREHRTLRAFQSERILWTGSRWAAPEECLLGRVHRATFGEAVPVLVAPKEALVALGVPQEPQARHWSAFFAWVDLHHGGAFVPRSLRRVLHRVYARLGAVPDGLPATCRVLLDQRGHLHSMQDAARSKLVIDDDPFLADSLLETGASVSFADAADSVVQQFFRAAGVKPLSAVARLEKVTFGKPATLAWAPKLDDLLAWLHSPHLASALSALVASYDGSRSLPPRKLAERLRHLDAIEVVTSIHRHYLVGDHVGVVETNSEVDGDRIVVVRPRKRARLVLSVGQAVARLADPTGVHQGRLADAVPYLLECRSPEELRRELAERKVPWRAVPADAWSDEEEADVREEDDLSEIADLVAAAALTPRLPAASGPSSPPAVHNQSNERTSRAPLPALDDVHPMTGLTRPPAESSATRRGGGGGGSSWWTPRTPDQVEADEALGRHAEQIVLRNEREVVCGRGMDEDRVVWTADANPAADHDIRSVDVDGEELWIEVKATTGRGGRFLWPKSEFDLALRVRDRYILCRVYDANTVTPMIVRLRDPIGLIQDGRLTLNVDTLAADAGSIESGGSAE